MVRIDTNYSNRDEAVNHNRPIKARLNYIP